MALSQLYGYIKVPIPHLKLILQSLQKIELGNVYAANNIAAFYLKGEGVEKDLKKVMQYYQIGADRGDYAALYNLGLQYSQLNNPKEPAVPFDYFKAYEWYDKSLQIAPNPCAANDIGIIYSTGKTNNLDANEAKKYFKLSVITLLQGIPEGDKITIDPSIDKFHLVDVYAEYQYAHSANLTNSNIAASPAEKKLVENLAGKIVNLCWD